MNRLIFNQQVIRQKTGLDTEQALLLPRLDLESKVASSPFMLEKDDGSCILVAKDIECGNFHEEGLQAAVKYYRPYLTFDPIVDIVAEDWLELVQENVEGNKLEVDECIYYAAFKELQAIFDVNVTQGASWRRVYLYEINPDDVSNQMMVSYEQCRADVNRVAPSLTGYLENFKNNRFKLLDEMLAQLKLDALLVSSPLNQQEIAGLPLDFFTKSEAVTFYYHNKVYVLSSQPIFHSLPQLTGVFPDLRTGLKSLIGNDDGHISTGIEENHLPYGLFREVGLKEAGLRCISTELRKWREVSAGEELPYYIIAAQAARFGIETAIQYAENALNRGESILETDVEKQLYIAYQKFVEESELSISIRPYHTVLHSGSRSRRPNPPQFAPINADTRTMKIDAGLLAIDKNGLVRAVSDLARTLVRDENSRELYRFIENQMVNVAIPAAIPGKTGEEIYCIGTMELIANQNRWVEIGVLPEGIDLTKGYNRDIGHVLGKQEPVTLTFRQGNKVVLKNGMVCCMEYHWPYYPYGIGIEDMFAVTSQGVVNITR